MPHRSLLLILLGALLATAAQAAKVQVRSDPDTDLSAFRTYSWRLSEGPGDEILDREIRQAADEMLSDKGLQRIETSSGEADLLIDYVVGGADLLRSGWIVEVDWWGFALTPGGRSSVEAGLLMILRNKSTDKPVWGGQILVRGNTPQALEVMRKRAGKYTKKLLKKYPKLPKE